MSHHKPGSVREQELQAPVAGLEQLLAQAQAHSSTLLTTTINGALDDLGTNVQDASDSLTR